MTDRRLARWAQYGILALGLGTGCVPQLKTKRDSQVEKVLPKAFADQEDPGTSSGVTDWRAFFTDNRRAARPTTVVRAYARPGEGRAYWVEALEGSKKVEEEFVPQIASSLNARLDEEGRRRWMIDQTAQRTGRVEATFSGPDRIEVKSSQVNRLRLYLEPDMFSAKGPLVVKVGNRRRKPKVAPSAEVLLVDFAQRLDRRFLPVAAVEVKR